MGNRGDERKRVCVPSRAAETFSVREKKESVEAWRVPGGFEERVLSRVQGEQAKETGRRL